jgi:hypothetical protein
METECGRVFTRPVVLASLIFFFLTASSFAQTWKPTSTQAVGPALATFRRKNTLSAVGPVK